MTRLCVRRRGRLFTAMGDTLRVAVTGPVFDDDGVVIDGSWVALSGDSRGDDCTVDTWLSGDVPRLSLDMEVKLISFAFAQGGFKEIV